MNWNQLYEKISQRVTLARQNATIPGCVIGVRFQNEEKIWAFGESGYARENFMQRWEANPPIFADFKKGSKLNLSGNSRDFIQNLGIQTFESHPSYELNIHQVYDCASVTKSIPLAVLALLALQEGKYALNTHLSELDSRFGANYVGVTIWHLLTHTLDYRFSLGEVAKLNQDVVGAVLGRKFEVKPGEVYCYSNSSSLALSVLLEKIYDLTFDELAQKKVFDPLDMTMSGFQPKATALAVEFCPWRNQVIEGEVHDESASSILPHHLGAAGLFSNVPDLMKFLAEIHNAYHGQGQLLDKKMVDLLLQNQIPGLATTSLGMEYQEPRFMGPASLQLKTLGKTGFTGTNWTFAPEEDVGFVCLSNFPWPRRLQTADAINEFRRDLSEIIFQEI